MRFRDSYVQQRPQFEDFIKLFRWFAAGALWGAMKREPVETMSPSLPTLLLFYFIVFFFALFQNLPLYSSAYFMVLLSRFSLSISSSLSLGRFPRDE